MLGPGSATDYSRRLVRVLELQLPGCDLEWNVGRCAPESVLIEGMESASEWTIHGDGSGIAADTSDPISGDQRLTFAKGTAATGYAGIVKEFDFAQDLSGYERLRVCVGLTAADLAKASKVEVYLSTTTAVADYNRYDFSTLVEGDNFLEFVLLSPTGTSGSPLMTSVLSILVNIHTTVAADSLAAPTVDDFRAMGNPTAPCYKTLATSQAPEIFRNHNSLKNHRFSEQDAPAGTPGVPLLVPDTWTESAQKIDPKRGLGTGATISATLADPLHDDQGTDPYFAARPTRQGHQMSKFLARHKYLQGKTANVYEGWVYDDGRVPPLSEMDSRLFRVDTQPQASAGRAVLRLVDPLSRLEWSDAPEDLEGELAEDVTAATLTWKFSDATIAATYPSSDFYLACEDEIVHVTSRSGVTLTLSERGVDNTDAATHDAEEGLDVVDYHAGDVDTVLQGILNDAGLADALLDLTTWSTENDTWAPEYTLSVWIRRSTRRSQTLQDFCEGLNLMVWWDSEAQLVKMRFGRPLAPLETAVAIDDRIHSVKKYPTTVTPQEKERITRVRVYHNVRSWAEKLRDGENYKTRRTYIDGDAEHALQYGGSGEVLREVFAYWLPVDQKNEAEAIGFRVLDRYRDAPDLVKMTLGTARASLLSLGSIVQIVTERRQDEDGLPRTLECICIEKKRKPKSRGLWQLQFIETSVFGRWWFWSADTAGNYPLTKAYAHWANEQGKMPTDASDGYKFL